jgi:uncharacterized protein (DUF2384 family)
MSDTKETVDPASIQEIFRLVLELFDGDGSAAAEWMTSSGIQFLHGRRPLDLLNDAEGRYKVWVCLQRAIHGVYS